MRTAVSLFSGIGLLDLAAQRAGFEIVAQVEIEEAAVRVLEARFPGVRRYRDVREVGAAQLPRDVDLIVGGFPCQDASSANTQGRGLDGERTGLWREYRRIIEEARPRWVLIENVARLLSRGAARVVQDLAALGYDAEWDVVGAAHVGAPHLRERWWCVAWDASRVRVPDAERDDLRIERQRLGEQRHEPRSSQPRADGADGRPLADGDGDGREGERRGEVQHGERAAPGHDAHRRGEALADAEGLTEREPADVPHAVASGRTARSVAGGRSVRGDTFRIFDADALAEWRERCLRDVWPRNTAPAPVGAESRLGRTIDGRAAGVVARPIEPWEAGVSRAITQGEALERRRANGELRSHRLKGLGNGVVPQIPEWILGRVRLADRLWRDQDHEVLEVQQPER